MDGDGRNCANCRHYVVKDVKNNYEANGAGTYTQKIYGCEKWECEYEPKEEGSEEGRRASRNG